MVIGKRAMLVSIVIAALGIGACVVKTTPAHRHHRRPAAAEKHKKHKPHKHKKHKKHRHRHHH